MYKVLIADDEMLARVGVKSLISWKDYGFDVVAEAENGKKALELARLHQPDLILTDIKMPLMNGIELLGELRKQGHPAKVVILSAYDDFSYVKEAMKLGAEDYLIKLEMQPEQLSAILVKISDALKQAEQKQGVKHRQHLDRRVLRQKFLEDLLLGWIRRAEEAKERRDELQLPLPDRDLICFVLRPDDDKSSDKGSQDTHLLDFAVLNIMEEILRDNKWAYACCINPKQYAVLLVPELAGGKDHVQRSGAELVLSIQHTLKKFLNISMTVGISDVQPGLMEANRAYKQSCKALNHRFRFPKGSIIAHGLIDALEIGDSFEDPAVYSEALSMIAQALSGKDAEALAAGFGQLQMLLDKEPYPNMELFMPVCSALLFSVLAHFDERSKALSTERFRALYEELGKFHVRNDAIEWLKKCKQLAFTLEDQRDTLRLITQAKQWLAAHYAGDTSLETIAKQMNVSAKYFSALFKKQTGVNFVDYVTDIRMDKAKRLLLETNKRILEIASEVGYENEQYFSRVFKKTVGQSPLQYRLKG